MNASTTAIQVLCQSYWNFQRNEFPWLAIMAGQPVDHNRLMLEAPTDYQRRAEAARTLLDQVLDIAPAALDPQERTSRSMLIRELEALVQAVKVQSHLRPSLYPMGPEFMLQYFGGIVSIENKVDAQRWNARLSAIAQDLDGVIESLQAGVDAGIRYPKLVIARALPQIAWASAQPAKESGFYKPFAKAGSRFASIEALAEQAGRIIEGEVFPALRRYESFVRDTLGAVARDTIACTDSPFGPAFYGEMIRFNTTQDLDPGDLHRLGLAEVQRLRARMLETAGRDGFAGDLAGYQQHLKNDPGQFAASADALLEQMEALSKRIDMRLPEYFGRLPRSSYGLKLIPPAVAASMPPAYAQPNPADNSAPGIHWITSIPEKLPRYMNLPIALHEAWPGHLMHLALMQELDGLPDFRRYGAMRYSACLEGWALYCEQLGEEMGLYDSPSKLYGRLEMEIWRALRLVVDTGIHHLGWSRKQAVAAMVENMALPLATIEAEVDRYIGMPGQALAYQVGNLKFCELRRRAESRLGDAFKRRAFHDVLMAAGPVTLDVLDGIVENWIVEQSAPAKVAA
jgi:uncharacterized protein (DUF885 family)